MILAAVLALATSTPTVTVSTPSAPSSAAAPQPAKWSPKLHAVIHPESKRWTPLSLRVGPPSKAGYKGKSIARLYKSGEDRWLVISVFPRELDNRRRHFEVRFRLVEGYIEEVKAALVSVVDARPGVGAGLDSRQLDEKGIAFEEDTPASGQVVVAALDPRPSKSAFNEGVLKRAAFASGQVDVAWSAEGAAVP